MVRPALETERPQIHSVEVKKKSAHLNFEYAYPAEASGISALDALLKARLSKAQTEATNAAKDDEREMRASGFPFRPHELEVGWEVEGDNSKFLSLEGISYAYTGGAHGTTLSEGLLWDKSRGQTISIKSMFITFEAFERAVSKDFCKGLDQERTQRRGVAVEVSSIDGFNSCVALSDQVLIPAGDPGKPFNKIKVSIAPYEAGPYAEGTYEVDLPVTAAMLEAVKPEYREAFLSER